MVWLLGLAPSWMVGRMAGLSVGWLLTACSSRPPRCGIVRLLACSAGWPSACLSPLSDLGPPSVSAAPPPNVPDRAKGGDMMGRIGRGQSCLDGFRSWWVGFLANCMSSCSAPLCHSILACFSALSPSYGVSEQERERGRERGQRNTIFREGERGRRRPNGWLAVWPLGRLVG